MAIPLPVAVGPASITTTNPATITYPAGIQAGDLLMLHWGVASNGGDPVVSGELANWSQISLTPSADFPRQWVFIKEAAGTESSTTFDVSSLNTARKIIRVLVSRGVRLENFPNVFEGRDDIRMVSTDQVTHPDLITSGVDRLGLCFLAANPVTSTADFTGETGGDFEEIASAGDTNLASQVQAADLASPTTVSGGSFTASVTLDAFRTIVLALQPEFPPEPPPNFVLQLEEDFTGTNGDPWDVAKWVDESIVDDDPIVDIQSNEGRLEATSIADQPRARAIITPFAQQRLDMRVTLPAAGPRFFFEAFLRRTGVIGTDSAYLFDIASPGSGGAGDRRITIRKKVNGVKTPVNVVHTIPDTALDVFMRCEAIGPMLRVAVRETPIAEGDWDAEVDESTFGVGSLLGPGTIALGIDNNQAGQTAQRTIFVDDVAVWEFQGSAALPLLNHMYQ